ncbi:hypothetical protein [Ferruginibacter sp.]
MSDKKNGTRLRNEDEDHLKDINYPAKEDIYNKFLKEEAVDPEDISKIKEYNEENEIEKNNEKDFSEDVSGSDLDIPGGELDDEQEAIGNEDEENNYYSLGGDNHNDLEEDKGE